MNLEMSAIQAATGLIAEKYSLIAYVEKPQWISGGAIVVDYGFKQP